MRDRPTWLVKTGPNWDGDPIDFIMFETNAMKNSADAIRGEISEIRFRCVISGLDDFAKFGGRYVQALKGMRRIHKTNRKIPFSLDMLEWIRVEYLQADSSIPARVELYTAAVLGFSPFYGLGN